LSANRKRTIQTQQIDLALNLSILQFIESQLAGVISKSGRLLGFYDDQKRVNNLRTLIIKNVSLNPSAVLGESSSSFLLPGDYSYLINDRSAVVINSLSRVYSNSFVDIEYLYDKLDNFLHKPKPNKPLSVIAGNKIYVYYDPSVTLSELRIDYLRKPATVALNNETINMIVDGVVTPTVVVAKDCDLPDHTHGTIIDLAIERLLRDVHSQAYQLIAQDIINKKTE